MLLLYDLKFESIIADKFGYYICIYRNGRFFFLISIAFQCHEYKLHDGFFYLSIMLKHISFFFLFRFLSYPNLWIS